MIRFDILTVFPEMFSSPLGCSLLKKAAERGLISVHLHDIRNHAEDKHRMTDDAPYGGGGGMVMKVEPIDRAMQSVPRSGAETPIILMTPQGERFCQKMAEKLAEYPQLILVCGHYEGVDERVRKHLVNREISIGDYVLTGGELSAMVIVDAVSRLVPGVLGNSESAATDSFSMGLLEYPHYTRPAEYRDWGVPEVLLNGNHREIEEWRRRAAILRTREKRPDLLLDSVLTAQEKKWLEDLAE
ncbi:MAG: tRNA (guanosine(37)-N1)-methyltransferase TrmD [Syntrophales bacterium]|jgi:tRNA (guanine37-N1)-methyltransferase|nr:tRNA (guanosine(37)-N1)-methyltransferase TrmD [Syntrophales bacterium]